MYLSGESRVDGGYGEKFHIIRYQQGYRDDFFIPVGVNPVRLKLFESGKILLPYDVIDAMLGLMHIPEQDFLILSMEVRMIILFIISTGWI